MKIVSTKTGRHSGQAMILAVLALGGALLGATAIAGFLTLYQIRSTTDSESSAKAIFAADAGSEWALFNYYCGSAVPARCVTPPDYPTSTFSNGVTSVVTCYNTSTPPGVVDCANTTTAAYALAEGTALGATRAFYVNLAGAAGTVP
jgi:hypothetical protein